MLKVWAKNKVFFEIGYFRFCPQNFLQDSKYHCYVSETTFVFFGTSFERLQKKSVSMLKVCWNSFVIFGLTNLSHCSLKLCEKQGLPLLCEQNFGKKKQNLFCTFEGRMWVSFKSKRVTIPRNSPKKES